MVERADLSVLFAGGAGRRMGGIDKGALVLGGHGLASARACPVGNIPAMHAIVEQSGAMILGVEVAGHAFYNIKTPDDLAPATAAGRWRLRQARKGVALNA